MTPRYDGLFCLQQLTGLNKDRSPGPYVGKLVVAYRWSAVYSTEPGPTVCTGFLCPQN